MSLPYADPTSRSGRRLKAGWRILLFLGILAGVAGALTLLLRATVGPPPGGPNVALALKGLLAAVAATSAVWLSRRLLDHESLASLGLGPSHAASDLLFGFVLSAFLVVATVALLLVLGLAQVARSDVPLIQGALLLVGTGLTVAWWEELVFRGYLFRNLADGIGLRLAVLASCGTYGLIHMLNPHATLTSAVVVAAIGFLRLLGLLSTNQLWLSMGMHAGWNFTQNAVFGLPVSGQTTDAILSTRITAPHWVSGAAFGFEGGLLGLAYAVIGAAAVLAWSHNRFTGRPPRRTATPAPGA
jgi:membrane protease YdiL (CAAX protease family)